MRNFVINDDRLISPFNEPARDLMVIGPDNEPATLRIHQKELTSQCIGPCPLEQDLSDIFELEAVLSSDSRSDVRPDDEVFVYRDNIYFDESFLQYFLKAARQLKQPCQAVLVADDPAWRKYSFPLSSLKLVSPYDDNEYYPIEMWYFPRGWVEPDQWHAIAVPSDALEKGYYNIPDSMSNIKVNTVSKRAGRRGQSQGMHREQDLTHWLSERTCVVIESWVHLFNASIPLGVFSYGSRFEERVKAHNIFAIRLFLRAILEQKQILSSSKMVKVGPGCDIHPEAIILGPTTIGRNCSIGPGVVIDNCIIGDNVNIAQGCQLMLSVVGHNSFLPFRAALFMTMIMENTIIAQNTCLQMCVIGRNSFIGAGTTFTDFNLLPSLIKATDHAGNIGDTGQPVLGGCVGHNCRIGAGLLIYPARMIESDVILTARPERRVIMKNITYEQSDHHQMAPRTAALHQRLYMRGVVDDNQLLDEWT